jgi:hypothetical protein
MQKLYIDFTLCYRNFEYLLLPMLVCKFSQKAYIIIETIYRLTLCYKNSEGVRDAFIGRRFMLSGLRRFLTALLLFSYVTFFLRAPVGFAYNIYSFGRKERYGYW